MSFPDYVSSSDLKFFLICATYFRNMDLFFFLIDF